MASTSMTSVGVRTSLSVTIATAKLVRHSMRGRNEMFASRAVLAGVSAPLGDVTRGPASLLNKVLPGAHGDKAAQVGHLAGLTI